MGRIVGVVYLLTNRANGKQYVGQTRQTLAKRLRRHRWVSTTKSRMPISLAIKKYGWNSFSVRVLCECDSQSELDDKEVYYAKTLKTFSPDGYNLRAGRGRGVVSDETKKRISVALTGRVASVETRRKLSESHRGVAMPLSARKKLSALYEGRTVSALGPLAASVKNAKVFSFVSPDGVLTTITNMTRFCMDNNLSPPKMCLVASGVREQHKGWRIPCTQKRAIDNAIARVRRTL